MLGMATSILELTAADLMSRDVVSIPQDMSLRAAAHLLSQAHITGAPVVNAEGQCVGVLSATDFLHWVEEPDQAYLSARAVTAETCCEWQYIDLEAVPADDVRTHMTSDPVTVAPETSIYAMAELMVEAHIHRVIVTDKGNRPIGMVSSTDILAAVARARRDRQEKGPARSRQTEEQP